MAALGDLALRTAAHVRVLDGPDVLDPEGLGGPQHRLHVLVVPRTLEDEHEPGGTALENSLGALKPVRGLVWELHQLASGARRANKNIPSVATRSSADITITPLAPRTG